MKWCLSLACKGQFEKQSVVGGKAGGRAERGYFMPSPQASIQRMEHIFHRVCSPHEARPKTEEAISATLQDPIINRKDLWFVDIAWGCLQLVIHTSCVGRVSRVIDFRRFLLGTTASSISAAAPNKDSKNRTN